VTDLAPPRAPDSSPAAGPADAGSPAAPGPADAGSSAAPATAPTSPAAKASSTVIHTTREIEALIPHRWPFLLVDRIVDYEPESKRIVGLKAVTASEWFFQGHFPGLPVMPGVLQVEALAQTMAIYVAKQPGFGDRIGLFAGIDECRFKRVVSPGDTLRLEIVMDKLGGRFGRGRGRATVDGETACEATLSFIIPNEGVLR
jgi:3-hydroxyacyl-[acyl-carrier-protein] dehydratase